MNHKLEVLPLLALFSRIVQFGSMSKAAKSLGLGRSAVSKQLNALEERLGLRLLQRSTRKLTLTEAGEQILEEANKLALAWENIESLSEELRGGVRGQLKVTCSSALGKIHLMPLLPIFHAQFPEIKIQLMLEDRFSDLIAEQMDVAIRIGHLPSSSLVARRLGEMSFIICASPQYLAIHGYPHSPAELLQHCCLHYENSTHTMNKWIFTGKNGEESVTIDGSLSINDATALVQAAVDGMGVLLIDKNMLNDHLETGRLIPLLQEYQLMSGFPVYALYPARSHLPLKTRAFVDFLSEYLSPKLS